MTTHPISDQESTTPLSSREQRIAEIKKRYPLRSSNAYKRLLPRKMYWGATGIVFIQFFMMNALFFKREWADRIILIDLLCLVAGFILVGFNEEEGPLYDNWRLGFYKMFASLLALQLAIMCI